MPAPPLEPLLAWGRSLGLTGDVAFRTWSTTARIGDTWLKACGSGGRYEAALLGALLWWGAPHAVLPLAVDTERGYVALPGSGPQLRSFERGLGPWPQLLAQHAELQRRLQPHADDAVALGVPDLRPGCVPDELDALLARTPLPAALSTSVMAGRPELHERCAALAAGPVVATVQHDDLHDGNLVVDDDGATRLIDWGDSSVGHPFGVLLVTLRSLQHLHDVDAAGLQRLTDAYLEPWTDLADPPTLRELAGHARHVQAVGRALAWERALRDADDDERAAADDPVAGWLEVLVSRS